MDVDALLAQNKRALRNIARGASPTATEYLQQRLFTLSHSSLQPSGQEP